jgi:hypothetical protein
MPKADPGRSRRSRTPRSRSTLEFIEGFAWPVPQAFSGAIAGGRFEQGDVLFCEAEGYEAFEGELSGELTAIQVLLPARGLRATPAELEGDRRLSNWESEVTIERIDLVRATTETRTISQGKLLMALWKGDEAWLDEDHAEPPLPRSARDLHQQLEQTSACFDADGISHVGCRFIFVVDRASDTSVAKARNIESALRETGAVERRDRTPRSAGVEEGELFHPTLVVRCLDLPDRSVDEVVPILRACLYGGGSSESGATAEQDVAARGRFSVARHGLLEAIGSSPAATRSGSTPS